MNVTREHYNGINTSVVWGGLNTTYAVYEHKVHFEANVFNDDDDYVVLLTPHCIGGLAYGVNRVMSLEIKEKHHTYFITTCYVYENIAAHPSTNLPWGFDFVVF